MDIEEALSGFIAMATRAVHLFEATQVELAGPESLTQRETDGGATPPGTHFGPDFEFVGTQDSDNRSDY